MAFFEFSTIKKHNIFFQRTKPDAAAAAAAGVPAGACGVAVAAAGAGAGDAAGAGRGKTIIDDMPDAEQ